ncbi:MAG: hypothetical protein SOI26_02060 [Coriobacteriales bacterium]|jgi:hypothetical protein
MLGLGGTRRHARRHTFLTILSLMLVITVLFAFFSMAHGMGTGHLQNGPAEGSGKVYGRTLASAGADASRSDDAMGSAAASADAGSCASSPSLGASAGAHQGQGVATALTEAVEYAYGVAPTMVASAPSDVVFIGDLATSSHASAVVWWSYYSKRSLSSYASVRDWTDAVAAGNVHASECQVIVVDPAVLSWDEADMDAIDAIKDSGTALVFCDAPDVELLKARPDVCAALGISGVRQDSVELTGLHLFEGLLWGKERVWGDAAGEDSDMLDGVDLDVAWYDLLGGSRAFLRGTVDIDEHPEAYGHDELTPPLVWRYSDGRDMTFVVQGGYLQGVLGMGLLSGFAGQLGAYSVYPIVNAQTLAINGFPDVADENPATMSDLYWRTSTQVQRDIVMGSLQSMLSYPDQTATFFLSPALGGASSSSGEESSSGGDGDASVVDYYLRAADDLSSEVGVTLDTVSAQVGDVACAAAQLDAGTAAVSDATGGGYEVASAFSSDESAALDALAQDGSDSASSQVRTLVTAGDVDADELPVASVVDVDGRPVTVQRALTDCRTLTALDDLRMRACEGALGYAVCEFDMRWLVWPRSDDDQWQTGYRTMLANYSSLMGSSDGLESTTASESDARLRTMLAMGYSQRRRGDVVTISVRDRLGDAYFMLRTNGERVVSVDGGDCEQVQDGWYVVRASSDEVDVTLTSEDSSEVRG